MRPVLIGDIVKIEGVVTEVSADFFRLNNNVSWIHSTHITEITTRWSPKVGDLVNVLDEDHPYTLLAIQKGAYEHCQWAVVTVGFRMPKVVRLSKIMQRVD